MKTCAPILFLAVASISNAQSTISNADRYAHAANTGWIDFRADATNGTRVLDTCLSGYAYSANFGWIHLDDGTPQNGHTYSNASATDCGVNLSPAGQLTGYAYAANIGWIALDTSTSDLATTTIARPDSDGDGIPDTWEQLRFGNLTTASATTDSDGDGASDTAEYAAGTLPKDANSRLRIISHSYPSASQANLVWTSVPNRLYRIEHDEDLVGVWANSSLGTLSSGGATTSGYLTGLATAPRRFFRAVAVLPLP